MSLQAGSNTLVPLCASTHLSNSSELHEFVEACCGTKELVLFVWPYQETIWLLPHLTIEGAGYF